MKTTLVRVGAGGIATRSRGTPESGQPVFDIARRHIDVSTGHRPHTNVCPAGLCSTGSGSARRTGAGIDRRPCRTALVTGQFRLALPDHRLDAIAHARASKPRAWQPFTRAADDANPCRPGGDLPTMDTGSFRPVRHPAVRASDDLANPGCTAHADRRRDRTQARRCQVLLFWPGRDIHGTAATRHRCYPRRQRFAASDQPQQCARARRQDHTPPPALLGQEFIPIALPRQIPLTPSICPTGVNIG